VTGKRGMPMAATERDPQAVCAHGRSDGPLSRRSVLRALLSSEEDRKALEDAWTRIPESRCHRQAQCCALLPEMSYLEALAVLALLTDLESAPRQHLVKRAVERFLLNPVQIATCPFLEAGDCLIYQHRPFGCRAYGLWSAEQYAEQSAAARRGKEVVAEQWRRLGVELPQAVVAFQVPYCPHVRTEGGVPVADVLLSAAAGEIEALSQRLGASHEAFFTAYLGDVGFLLASLALGYAQALRLKVEMVRHVLATGSRVRLGPIISGLADVLDHHLQ